MIIYPAIDCRDGKCVRLYQGDYKKETIYADSPLQMAKSFVESGATWMHWVDLDGAKNLEKNQQALLMEILRQMPISIQIGGGIRTTEQVEGYFIAGATRVVIGSIAIQDPQLMLAWLRRFGGDRLVLAVDVVFDVCLEPRVATQAWQSISPRSLHEVITQYQKEGLQHVLCTDIDKDGALSSPNFSLYETLVSQFPDLKIQASGGIRALEDFTRLKSIGVAGAITGRALYENKFTLEEALAC